MKTTLRLKTIALSILLTACTFVAMAQSVYTTNPAVGTFTTGQGTANNPVNQDCIGVPGAPQHIYYGGVIKMKVMAINGNQITFRVYKMDEQPFTGNGWFNLRETICAPITGNFNTTQVDYNQGDLYITIYATCDFTSGTVPINCAMYSETADKYYWAGTINITATPSSSISLNGNLSFGNVQVNTTATKTFTISNTGNATLNVTSINYPSGFSGNWSGAIAAGQSQTVTVTFAPTQATTYGGNVTVNSNAASGTNTIAISGTGTAAPVATISLSGNLSFGNVQVNTTATKTFTISNTGNATLNVTSINYPSGFSGNWSGAIAAGQSQTVTVTFAPTQATTYGGNVTVYSNAASGTNTITCSGTGTNIPCPNPTADFIANPTSGNAPLTVSFTNTSTAGSGQTIGTCFWDLGGGSSTENNPQYIYSNAGAYTISLTVTNSCGNSDTETKNDYISIQNSQTASCYLPPQVLPRINSLDIPTRTQFIWEKVPNATEYELEVQEQNGNPIRNIIVPDVSYRLQNTEALQNGEIVYKWRVRAKTNGAWGEWSDTRNFTTLHSETDWFNGNPQGHFNNAIAYSNDGNNGYPGGNSLYLNYSSGAFTGLKWQCVEFDLRAFYQIYGLKLISHGQFNRHAKYFFGSASVAGLLSYPVGSDELPKPGDMLCWGGTGYGHVAIVQSVDLQNMKVFLIQQNANPFLGKELNITNSGNGYKIVYVGGQTGYMGIVRAKPQIYYPLDGAIINTVTPTFRWEDMPANNFTLYIKEKDEFGCYNLIHTIQGSGHSYYLPPEKQLTPGKEYLYRLVNKLPAGNVSNEIIFFSVSPTKSGVSQEILPTEILVSVKDVNNMPLSNVRIYTQSESEWVDRKSTNNYGSLFFSTFDEIAIGDLLQASCNGYQTHNHYITEDDLNSGYINIQLQPEANSNFVINPSIEIWENNMVNNSPFFTNTNTQLKITAQNHNSYFLVMPYSEIEEEPLNCIEHLAGETIVNYPFQEGINNIIVYFANEYDTLQYSQQFIFIPEANVGDTTYTVTVLADMNSIGSKVFIDDKYIKTMETASEQFVVFNGTRRFSFIKNNYGSIFETTNNEATINLKMYQVGVENLLTTQSLFSIYPNPAENSLNISFNLLNEESRLITIYDILGKKLYSKIIVSHEDFCSIDVSNLTYGIYFIELQQGTSKQTLKFIKN